MEGISEYSTWIAACLAATFTDSAVESVTSSSSNDRPSIDKKRVPKNGMPVRPRRHHCWHPWNCTSRAVVALSADSEGKFEVLGVGKVPENLLDGLPMVLPRITEGLR